MHFFPIDPLLKHQPFLIFRITLTINTQKLDWIRYVTVTFLSMYDMQDM